MPDAADGMTFMERVKHRKRLIRMLAEQGAYAAEIARVLDCSRGVVQYHADRMHLVLPRGRRVPLEMFSSQIEIGRGFVNRKEVEACEIAQPPSRP